MIQSWGLSESLNQPAWSISAEWAAYLVFPLLVAACVFRRPAFAWSFGILCVVVLGALSEVPVSWGHQSTPIALLDLSDPRFAFPVLRCLAEFSLGLIAFRMMNTPVRAAIAGQPWIMYAICLSWIVLMAVPRADLAVVLLLPFLVISITSEQHWPGKLLASRPFEFAGQLSYSIYLIHALMRGIIGRAHEHLTILGFKHALTYAACCGAAITFFLSYLAYHAIEVPGRRWCRRAFEGEQPPVITPEATAS